MTVACLGSPRPSAIQSESLKHTLMHAIPKDTKSSIGVLFKILLSSRWPVPLDGLEDRLSWNCVILARPRLVRCMFSLKGTRKVWIYRLGETSTSYSEHNQIHYLLLEYHKAEEIKVHSVGLVGKIHFFGKSVHVNRVSHLADAKQQLFLT
jgi:hypothetical protein